MLLRTTFRLAIVGLFLGVMAGQLLPDIPASPPAPNALQSLPLSAERRALLQDAIRQRAYETAERILAAEAEANPRSQPLLLVLANILFLDGKHLNSAVVLKKAGLLHPLDEQSRFLLALSWIAVNRNSMAVAELSGLAQANPSNAMYPYWLSRLTYRNNLQRGFEYAQQAVRLNPEFMKGYDQLGLCLTALNRNDDAIRSFRTGVRLNEQQGAKWPWPALNLGTLLIRLERFDEAEAALRNALDYDLRFPTAHLRLAKVLELTGRPEEAIAELKEAVRWDATYPEPHYALARIYRRRNLPELAKQELEHFQTLRKRDNERGIRRPD